MVPPNSLNPHGNKKTTNQLKIQFVSIAIDMAVPLARLGKISDTSVQNTGPMHAVKKLKKRNIKINTTIPLISGMENVNAKSDMETAIPADPARYNFLLPVLSIKKIATHVKIKFTMPIPIV